MTDRTEYLPPFLLKPDQVAKVLGVSKPQVYALMRRGELEVVRIGRSVRVKRNALESFIEENTDKGSNGKKARK